MCSGVSTCMCACVHVRLCWTTTRTDFCLRWLHSTVSLRSLFSFFSLTDQYTTVAWLASSSTVGWSFLFVHYFFFPLFYFVCCCFYFFFNFFSFLVFCHFSLFVSSSVSFCLRSSIKIFALHIFFHRVFFFRFAGSSRLRLLLCSFDVACVVCDEKIEILFGWSEAIVKCFVSVVWNYSTKKNVQSDARVVKLFICAEQK